MADELQIINQPDSVPGAYSTSYSRQLTKQQAIENGLDCSAPVVASATTITLPIGGPVDVNGVLYSITSAITLTISSADTDYYIYLAAGSTSDYLTPTLTTNAGTFDASKNARYTAGGDRILNWVVRRDASAAEVIRMIDPQKIDVQQVGVDDSPTFDDLTVNGAIKPTASPTTGSYSSTTVLGRGIYNFSFNTTLGSGYTAYIEAYISGSWKSVHSQRGLDAWINLNGAATVYADGSNVRISLAATVVAYYQKF